MGLMDKVKAQATQLAQKAQETAQEGKARIDQAQSGRQADIMLRNLGAIVFAQHTGRAAPDAEDQVAKIVAEISAHEATNGINLASQPVSWVPGMPPQGGQAGPAGFSGQGTGSPAGPAGYGTPAGPGSAPYADPGSSAFPPASPSSFPEAGGPAAYPGAGGPSAYPPAAPAAYPETGTPTSFPPASPTAFLPSDGTGFPPSDGTGFPPPAPEAGEASAFPPEAGSAPAS